METSSVRTWIDFHFNPLNEVITRTISTIFRMSQTSQTVYPFISLQIKSITNWPNKERPHGTKQKQTTSYGWLWWKQTLDLSYWELGISLLLFCLVKQKNVWQWMIVKWEKRVIFKDSYDFVTSFQKILIQSFQI